MIRILTLVVTLAACGGKKAEPAKTAEPTAAGHPASGSGGGSNAEPAPEPTQQPPPAEVTKFHDLLAPLWHAAKGAKRLHDTCHAVPDFRANADAIAKVTTPAKTNADTWTTGTRALVDAVTKLEAACKAKDATKMEAAFAKLHEVFEGLMAQAGVEHKEGEHEHKM